MTRTGRRINSLIKKEKRVGRGFRNVNNYLSTQRPTRADTSGELSSRRHDFRSRA